MKRYRLEVRSNSKPPFVFGHYESLAYVNRVKREQTPKLAKGEWFVLFLNPDTRKGTPSR